MPRFDEMPQYVAKLPKSGHDLSHDFGFTATVAHLLPVFHTVVSPGDKIRLGVSYHLRTMPMQSAAMMRLRTHVEFFYVPMQLLYQPFSSMSFGIHDEFSSNFPNGMSNTGVQEGFPVLDFSTIVADLLANKSNAANGSYSQETVGQNAYRFFDMLGYNPVGIVNTVYPTNTVGWNPNVFPYPILAYNCIYQYYYRLDTRELFDQNSFNWDKFYNTASVTATAWSSDYCQLHYRPFTDDYFTNIKVSPIVDVLNLNQRPQSLSLAENWLSRGFVTSNNNVLGSGGPGSLGSSPSTLYSNSPSKASDRRTIVATQFGFNGNADVVASAYAVPYNGLDINTANIRAMFANEKLWSVTGRARKHYDDQVLAHFGVHVPHDVKHEMSVFGHDQSTIAIGEVFNTSDSYDPGTGTGTPLGEIAGKGYGSQDPNGGNRVNYHDFTAPVHGVVMAIFSVVPDYNYENTYPKHNVLTDRQSLPIPEYDHLGMQPLFGYESNIRNAYQTGTYIKGWQYRYEQWKRRYNRVTQAFNNSSQGSLRSWMMSIMPYYAASGWQNVANNGNFELFTTKPNDLNQVMLASYPSSWSSAFEGNMGSAIYNNDPFVVDMHIDCKLSSWMSDYSLPRLDA